MNSVVFVLVRTQQARNLGQAARALANQGFGELRLVAPVPTALGADAWVAASSGARPLLDRVLSFATLPEALEDCAWVFGTSARLRIHAAEPVRGWAARLRSECPGDRIAVVFGPERTGLSREELALCHGLLRIPTAPEAPALNLAQAVLIVAYELRVALSATAVPAATRSRSEVVTVGVLEAALAQWVEALKSVGYLRPDLSGELRRVAALRALLRRAHPSAGELALLRGLARQIAWAGGVAQATGSRR